MEYPSHSANVPSHRAVPAFLVGTDLTDREYCRHTEPFFQTRLYLLFKSLKKVSLPDCLTAVTAGREVGRQWGSVFPACVPGTTAGKDTLFIEYLQF